MTTMTVPEAIRSGMARGISLALNPTIENYRRIRTKPVETSSTVTQAWESVGRSMREAMEAERQTQQRSDSSQ